MVLSRTLVNHADTFVPIGLHRRRLSSVPQPPCRYRLVGWFFRLLDVDGAADQARRESPQSSGSGARHRRIGSGIFRVLLAGFRLDVRGHPAPALLASTKEP